MSMNANELRVGNWVEVNGKIIKIESIDNEGINCEVTGGYYAGETERDYAGHFKNNWFISGGGIITPIPLSPEILGKCGFVLNRNNELSIEINDIASHLELMIGVDGFYYPSFTQTPQGDEERTVYFNRINSLHQLQNLYYALTGEELNYTP